MTAVKKPKKAAGRDRAGKFAKGNKAAKRAAATGDYSKTTFRDLTTEVKESLAKAPWPEAKLAPSQLPPEFHYRLGPGGRVVNENTGGAVKVKGPPPMHCVGCGCTVDAACEDGCFWVRKAGEPGGPLCSVCDDQDLAYLAGGPIASSDEVDNRPAQYVNGLSETWDTPNSETASMLELIRIANRHQAPDNTTDGPVGAGERAFIYAVHGSWNSILRPARWLDVNVVQRMLQDLVVYNIGFSAGGPHACIVAPEQDVFADCFAEDDDEGHAKQRAVR